MDLGTGVVIDPADASRVGGARPGACKDRHRNRLAPAGRDREESRAHGAGSRGGALGQRRTGRFRGLDRHRRLTLHPVSERYRRGWRRGDRLRPPRGVGCTGNVRRGRRLLRSGRHHPGRGDQGRPLPRRSALGRSHTRWRDRVLGGRRSGNRQPGQPGPAGRLGRDSAHQRLRRGVSQTRRDPAPGAARRDELRGRGTALGGRVGGSPRRGQHEARGSQEGRPVPDRWRSHLPVREGSRGGCRGHRVGHQCLAAGPQGRHHDQHLRARPPRTGQAGGGDRDGSLDGRHVYARAEPR